MSLPWIGKILGWPSRVYRREDTGSTYNEAEAAVNAQDSYAVASGTNLDFHNSTRMKIAMFIEPTPFTHISGYSTRFKNLIRQLKEFGDEILVIVPDNKDEAPIEFEGVTIKNTSGFQLPMYEEVTVTFALKDVYSILKEFKPDVLHATTPGLSTFALISYARMLKIPLLLSYHTHLPKYAELYGYGMFSWLIWTLLRVTHNSADFTLTTSPQLCEEIIQNGFQRVGLWRKGIDVDVFNPEKKSDEMRYKMSQGHPQDPLIVCVGRLGPEKNLKFFKELMRRIPEARLALIGDGPMREKLERMLKDSRTYFSGTLEGEQLAAAFASADVFVIPSVTETLGFVALESMASGVPVVGARAGGIPDMVKHKETGYLFTPDSHDECERYVRKIIEDPGHRDKLALQARMEAMKWSWRASAAATKNVGYGRAISSFFLQHRREEAPIRFGRLLGNESGNIQYYEEV